VCDLETSRMGAPYIYIYDISRLRVNIVLVIKLRKVTNETCSVHGCCEKFMQNTGCKC